MYIKYTFDYFDRQAAPPHEKVWGWTEKEIDSALPEDGLKGCYDLAFSRLKLDPSFHFDLLHDKVLPIMAASLEPLSVEQLEEIIQLPIGFSVIENKEQLSMFFRLRRSNVQKHDDKKARLLFYHKTVKEWLLQREESFKQVGDKMIAGACTRALKTKEGCELGSSLGAYSLRNAIYHIGNKLKSPDYHEV